MKKFYIGILTTFLSVGLTIVSNANVTITTLASKTNLCLNAAAVGVGNIVITESGSKDEFGTGTATNNNLFIIEVPAGFSFNTGASMTISAAGGGNVTIGTATPLFKTASSIGFVYNTDNNATKNLDVITISGIQIVATALGTGTITLSSGSATVNGINQGASGTGTSLGNLGTAITAIVPANNVAKCNNDANFNLAGYSRTPATGTESFSSALLSPSTPCGACITGTNTFVPTAATAGSNVVTYNVAIAGCNFTATSTVDINASPTVALSIDETSGNANSDNKICNDATGDITLTGSGANSYSFLRNGGVIGSTNGMVYNHNSFNNGDNFSVIGTASNGCKDTIATPQTISKYNFNVVPFTFNPDNSSFSTGAPVYDLFLHGGPAQPSSGVFSGPGVYYDYASFRYLFDAGTANPGGNNVVFTATDANGCSNSITKSFNVASGSINIQGWGPKHCYDSPALSISVPSSTVVNSGYNAIFYYYDYVNDVPVYLQATQPGGAGTNWVATVTPSALAYSPAYQSSAYIYVYEGVGTSLYYYRGYEQAYINPVPVVSINNDFYSPVFYHCPNETTLQLITTPANNQAGAAFQFYSANPATAVQNAGTNKFIYKNGGNNYFYIDWSKAQTYPSQNYIIYTYTDPVTGCSNTATSGYIYTDPPGNVPVLTGLAPKYYCQGDNITDQLSSTKDPNKYVYWYTTSPLTQVASYNINDATTSVGYAPGVLSANTDFVTKQSNVYGTCLSNASNTVTVQVNPPIAVSAGIDNVICGTATATYNLSASTPTKTVPGFYSSGVSHTWTSSSSGTVGFSSSTALTPTYTPSATDKNAGSVLLTITTADPDGNVSLGCPAVSDYMILQINQQALVSSGGPYVFCGSDPVMQLNATSSSNVTVTWSGVPANISNLSSTTSLNPIYTPTVGDKAGGTYTNGTGLKGPTTFNLTITTSDPDGAGPCGTVNSPTSVDINPAVKVDAGTDVAICGHKLIPSGLKVALSTASISIGGSGGVPRLTPSAVNAWSVYSGSGGLSGVNFNSNFHVDYAPTGSLADSGTIVSSGTGELGNLNVLTLKLKSNDPDGSGPCVADSDFVNITLYPRPIPSFVGLSSEYCKNTPAVFLYGNLSSTIPTNALFTGTAVSTFGNNFKFDPTDPTIPASGANVVLTYKHTDGNTCNNFVNSTVKVYPIPQVKFSMSSRCQNDSITFSDLTSIPSGTFTSGITSWDWKFDNTFSYTTQNTKFAFNNYGTHSAKLTVSTSSGGGLGCNAYLDSSFIIAPYPTIDYSWFRACSIDSVVFTNATTIPGGSATYPFGISWNMGGAGAYKNATNNLTFSPFYKYTSPGRYNVTLTATTNIYGCKDSLVQEVYVLPTIDVTATSPYNANFRTSDNLWSPSGQNYSWQYGTIISGKSSNMAFSTNAWVTNLSGKYHNNELSAMNSPCFNFSNLAKPMVALNLLSSINNNNLGGGVLQYSKNYGATWVTIGKIGQGANWYGVSGVVGLIGVDINNNPLAQGWSGISNGFVSSKIGLSNLANEDTLVRLRVVFASPNLNVGLDDGLALDSFWVGNRTKTVLLEHFTNSLSTPSIQGNDTVNSIQNQRTKDMVSIHYHTSFPGVDNMNLKNTADPSARVLYYGVSSTPYSFVDGTNSYNTYTGATPSFTVNNVDAKALDNAKFDLDVSTVNTTNSVLAKVRIKAKQTFNGNLIVQVAVLENSVSSSVVGGNQSAYKWVVKKMLPDAGGTYVSKNWAMNDSLFVVQNWDYIASDVYDPSQVSVVAFVQNIATKEVYQAAYISGSGSSNPSSPVVYTSVEDAEILSENVMVFPNPATTEAYVLFGKGLSESCDYVVYDQVGKVVASGKVNKGIEGFSLNTSSYSDGAYQISLIKSNGSKIHKQLLIIH